MTKYSQRKSLGNSVTNLQRTFKFVIPRLYNDRVFSLSIIIEAMKLSYTYNQTITKFSRSKGLKDVRNYFTW